MAEKVHNSQHQDFDIIIIGSGIIGLTMAGILAVHGRGLRVALLDSQDLTLAVPTPAYDTRVSAITRASQLLFANLGVWDELERRSPYREMRVWDAAGPGSIHFASTDIGEPDLGHIIEHNVLCQSLLQRLKAHHNIEIFAPVHCQSLWQNKDHLQLTLSTGTKLTTKLLIGADGARSWVRQQAEIVSYGWDYQHAALVATVQTEHKHELTARQRFLTTGPLAFLPLSDPQTCSIVWSTTPAHAQTLADLPAEKFQQQLALGFEYRLGKITSVGPRATFRLHMHHAKNYVKPRIALIGDAAHTIHPLAGQGVNLGLLDAAWLAEVILTTKAKNRDFGALHNLRPYERQRKHHNWQMIMAIEGFKQTFGIQWQPLQWLRNRGLNATDRLVPVKQLCMRKAMGLLEELPGFLYNHPSF